MIARLHQLYDVTLCLPFHPEQVPNTTEYYRKLEGAKNVILDRTYKFLACNIPQDDYEVKLYLNTKDREDKVYLAPFGTALGKGDCGVVGRGNRYNGVISSVRCSSMEAVAGKNPIHHAGKLFTTVAHSIATRVYRELGHENQIIIAVRNGSELSNPAYVNVDLVADALPQTCSKIREIVFDEISRLAEYSTLLIRSEPVERFKMGGLVLGQMNRF